MTGRWLGHPLVLLLAFAVTRVLLTLLAAAGGNYPYATDVSGNPIGDVVLFERYARDMLGGLVPYRDVAIEYPSGVLPWIVLPGLVASGQAGYLMAFIGLCALLDLGVFMLLRVRARRSGAGAEGVWVWILGPPLLGALTYLRLDLVPALATVLAGEWAARARWRGVGVWLGAGAAAKVFPGLLLVPMLAGVARRRGGRGGRRPGGQRRVRQVLGGAVVGGLVSWMFAGFGMIAMFPTVLPYHMDRGLQVESVWATPLLIALRMGAPVEVVFDFRAYEVHAAAAPLLEWLATVGALGAVALGARLTVRAVRQRPRSGLVAGMFVTIILLLATGSVLSPQYMIWALALGAAALAAGARELRGPVFALVPLALLTQLVFPVLYGAVLDAATPGLEILVLRNMGLVAVAAWACVRVAGSPRVGAAQQEALDQVVPAADQAALNDVGRERTV